MACWEVSGGEGRGQPLASISSWVSPMDQPCWAPLAQIPASLVFSSVSRGSCYCHGGCPWLASLQALPFGGRSLLLIWRNSSPSWERTGT